MNELISVIIPVYNVEPYLAQCLESVLASTYKNIEVICINDGSTDRSLKILKEYAETDNRIAIIDKKNEGVSAARNDGLKAASGAWISFVDSDDRIHPQFFEILINIAEKTNADVVIGGHIRKKEFESPVPIDTRNIKTYQASTQMIYRDRNMKSFVWGKLYKAAVLNGHSFDRSVFYGEDSLFNIQVYSSLKSEQIFCTDEILYYYNDRGDSAVNTADASDRAEQGRVFIEKAVQSENELVRKHCLTEGIKRTLLARYTESCMENRSSVIRSCNQILRNGVRILLDNKSINYKEKCIYTLFAYIPAAYRYWRIIDDPSMKDWEQKQKAKRR